MLVPVPSSRPAARARGGDHLLRLAWAVGRQARLPVLTALRLAGPVADSAGLSASQRRAQPGRPDVCVEPAVRTGWQPIVLDDIVTTGATLAEAARALTAAGWQPAAAAVVAATRLRRPAPPSGRPRHGRSQGRGPPV